MSHKATACTLAHPAVAAPVPYGTSETYSHIPTGQIVETLHHGGWQFEHGSVRTTRKPERRAAAAHVLRFSHPDMPTIRGCRVEAVLVNSHDASTSLRLAFGVFRLACANGLIVQSCSLGDVRMSHHRINITGVREQLNLMMRRAPEVAGIVDRWSGIQLDAGQQQTLSRRCAQLRWDDAIYTETLLRPRRDEDRDNDLWTVFNRAQECVLRGGIRVARYDGENGTSIRTAAPVRGALRQVQLNQRLWEVAEEFAITA